MAGLDSLDDAISKCTASGKCYDGFFNKQGAALTSLDGTFLSLWAQPGNPPAGAAPGNGSGTPGAGGTARTNAIGSLFLPDTSTDRKFLVELSFCVDVTSTLMIYDRIVDIASISLTSVANVNVNSAALPRYSGAEAWLEFTTASTTTAAQMDLRYTNDTPTASRQGPTIAMPNAAMPIGTMIKLPLQAGDKAVSSIQTLNVSVATTAGVANLVLLQPIAYIGCEGNNQGRTREFVVSSTFLRRVYDGASLAFALQSQASLQPTITGMARFIYG